MGKTLIGETFVETEINTHLKPYTGKKKDDCHFCAGRRGGEPGNENIIRGLKVCDYCSADIIDIERGVRDETLAVSIQIALWISGKQYSSPEEKTTGREIAEAIESVRLTKDGRWKDETAMRLWGNATGAAMSAKIAWETYDGNGKLKNV